MAAKGDVPKTETSLTVTVALKISSRSFSALYLSSTAVLAEDEGPGCAVAAVATEAVMTGGREVTMAGAATVFLAADQGSEAESN